MILNIVIKLAPFMLSIKKEVLLIKCTAGYMGGRKKWQGAFSTEEWIEEIT